MSHELDNAEWRMTQESLPPRPDDREWRKRMALRLLPVAALVVLLLLCFFDVKWAGMAGTVLVPIVAAVQFHFRRHESR